MTPKQRQIGVRAALCLGLGLGIGAGMVGAAADGTTPSATRRPVALRKGRRRPAEPHRAGHT